MLFTLILARFSALGPAVSLMSRGGGRTRSLFGKAVAVTGLFCGLALPAGSMTLDEIAARAAENGDRIGEVEAGLDSLESIVDTSADGTRFEACANGVTVADHDTGLLWERKTGTYDSSHLESGNCETAGCPDAHDVNNRYKWSNTGRAADGNAFTDFLAKLNNSSQHATWSTVDQFSVVPRTSGCFADHCDWRLPNIVELRTILDCSHGISCVDPLFGPTASTGHWSASSYALRGSRAAWIASFNQGRRVQIFNKQFSGLSVRAVRAGSCTH